MFLRSSTIINYHQQALNTMGQSRDKLGRCKKINVINCLQDYQQHNITA